MLTRRITAALALAAVLLTADADALRARELRDCCAGAGSGPQAAAPSSSQPVPTQPVPTQPAPTPTSARPSPVAPPSPTRTAPSVNPAGRLAAGLTGLFGTGSSYSVAALDLTTGRSSQAGAHGGMVLASLVKLDILQTLLYQRQRSGQPLTDGQQDDVEAMIEHSDNAAADRIFRLIGRAPGLGRYNAVLGLHDTVLNTAGLWGLSTTSAADQLLVLQALVSPRSPLTAASRRYALDLLGQVEADQRWGVSAAGDPGSTTLNKNGWLGVDADRGRWAVTTAGLVRIGGHQVLMAVLSQHQPDFATAVARVERAARMLAATL
ncbi:serine hydrolase [Jatrophihabitans sp.]|uniref:serine hydrolase n=1 Tax=Jatrophihabitans sp. TaxID=1932789 RepID=UPI002C6E444C|nr:serine hydrolase [Jatrophihabitans sp.]